MDEHTAGLSAGQAALKRCFDVVVSLVLSVLTSPLVALGWATATLETRANGFFRQERVGKDGATFNVIKLRTMYVAEPGTTVTRRDDARISRSGRWLRTLKIDELPQLFNVLAGDMSLVGPRPDVRGYADTLSGPDRVILSVRPGITGPATLAFRHEEHLLAGSQDPEAFNRDVIWPEKVRINRAYVEGWSFRLDLSILVATVRSVLSRHTDASEEVTNG